MRVSIVTCGQSAENWYKTPVDISIGVNDCFKFGHRTNWLVVVNSPFKFMPSPKNGMNDRLKTICNHKPDRFFCHSSNWKSYYKNLELLTLKPFIGRLQPDRMYSSKTSPIVAITLANAFLKPSKIILWGIDFQNHNTYKQGSKNFQSELLTYTQIFKQLEQQGRKLYIGDSNTVLKDHLPLYQTL